MDNMKKKKKFSFLETLGFGNKKSTPNTSPPTNNNPSPVYVGTAEKAIKDNKARKKKLLEQIN